MGIFLAIVAPPLLGALIGYFTNRLAITMLFRPVTEKRLFGRRIPMTPGVIPSNRKELAGSVGRLVGGELLSKQAIRTYVGRDDFRDGLEKTFPRLLPGFARRALRDRVIKWLISLRSRIPIEKLIEDKVNEYDVGKIEELIVGITRQHLRMICWFGAIIGAMIGCIQSLLNLLT